MQTNTVKKINHIPLTIVFSLVLVLGIVFLVLSFSILKEKIPENYVEVDAVISRIDENIIDDGVGDIEYEYNVYINYSYDGENFTDVSYDKYDSSMKQGGKVTIYVNPDNPTEFMSDTSDNFIFAIIAGVAIVIGAVGLGYNIKKIIEMKRREN